MQIPLRNLPQNFQDRINVVHSIDEPLDNLTVNDICKRCNISRKKFYSLFETKYDIMFWYVDFCATPTTAKIGSELTWREGIVAFIKLLDEERVLLTAVAPDFSNKPRSLFWNLREKRLHNLEDGIKACGKTDITPMLRHEIDIYNDLVPRLINLWMLPNDFESLDDFASFWINCVPRTLYWALDKESA